jgi:hypothetical protein
MVENKAELINESRTVLASSLAGPSRLAIVIQLRHFESEAAAGAFGTCFRISLNGVNRTQCGARPV